MTSIIEIRNLTKRYRQHVAVDGIDLDVMEGEIFGILGPNGAGKSTTLEMIEGLRDPDSGSISVDGIDALAEPDKVRSIIGVQLQTTSLFPYLKARELVALFGNFYNLPNPEERVQGLLKLVNLEEKADATIDELSGGQQQRLSIALALVNDPRITFLDEPTTGLDPHARRNLWETILGVRAAGTTVVLTTHYMEEAEKLCDRIAIMDAGKVIACDTPNGLIRSLGLDAVVSATINGSFTATEEDLHTISGTQSLDISNEHGETTLRISTSDAQATMVDLLQFAQKHNITLTDLNSARANLESVFLHLTGRTYEQHDEAEQTEEQPPRKRKAA